MLKTTVRKLGDVTVVDLAGKITLGAGDQVLHQEIDQLLDSGVRRILLNVENVQFIDSTGLGVLVSGLKTVEAMDGSLRLICPEGAVYNALSLSKLLPVFQVFTNEADAVESFGNTSSRIEIRQEDVLYEEGDLLAVITLNRPRQFNALNRQLLTELHNALVAAGHNPRIRALVITGAGRAFCFGADAEELKAGERLPETLERFQDVLRAIGSMARPVIAAVNGFATGAGLDLALACDLRVVSEKAKLASAFVRFGLVPDGGSTQTLQRIVGRGRAYELFATGRALDAQEALEWGVANRLAPASEVLDVALAWAAELAQGPRRALGRMKQLLDENAGAQFTTALEREAQAQRQAFSDKEFREGLQAHLEKRTPDFLKL